MCIRILEAFRLLDSRASVSDIIKACRQLFLASDEYHHAIDHPFTSAEVDAVANAIWEYIESLDDNEYREIVFDVPRVLEGRAIDYCEYASMFSEEMVYQHRLVPYESLELEDLRCHLKMYLVSMLFRYKFCASEDRAVFPLSFVVDYTHRLKVLLTRERREGDLSSALWTTIRALQSCEPLQFPGNKGSQGGR